MGLNQTSIHGPNRDTQQPHVRSLTPQCNFEIRRGAGVQQIRHQLIFTSFVSERQNDSTDRNKKYSYFSSVMVYLGEQQNISNQHHVLLL